MRSSALSVAFFIDTHRALLARFCIQQNLIQINVEIMREHVTEKLVRARFERVSLCAASSASDTAPGIFIPLISPTGRELKIDRVLCVSAYLQSE